MITVVVTSNLVISNLVLGSISLLWGFINSLQIIAHIPLLNVILPGNARAVYEATYALATFDLISMDPLLELSEEPLADVDRSETHDVQISEATRDAFGTTNPLLNLSLELTIFLGLSAVTALVFLLRLAVSDSRCCGLLPLLRRRLWPSALLRYGLEEYITYTIVVLIKLYALDFSTWFESLSSVFAMVMAVLIVSVPVWLWIFLFKHHTHIAKP